MWSSFASGGRASLVVRADAGVSGAGARTQWPRSTGAPAWASRHSATHPTASTTTNTAFASPPPDRTITHDLDRAANRDKWRFGDAAFDGMKKFVTRRCA